MNPLTFSNWSPAITMASSGASAFALNRVANTGFLQVVSSGLSFSLQVRHVGTGNYINWPCRDASTGNIFTAGVTVTGTPLMTLQFDARGVSELQVTNVSGSGSFYIGTSADSPALYPYKTIKTITGLASADVDLIAAVAGRRIKVTAYSLITTDNTGVLGLFKSNGTSGTELWRVYLKGPDASTPFGANLSVATPSFLFGTAAGEKLTLDVNSAAQIHYSLSYFDDDAS